MNNKSFVYNKSFEISLNYCASCNAYYNKNESHTCSNIPKESIDVIEKMKQNTNAKKQSKKKDK